MRRRTLRGWPVLACALAMAACASNPAVNPSAESARPASSEPAGSVSSPDSATPAASTPQQPNEAAESPSPAPAPGTVPPQWLGTRVLPLRADGAGQAQPTPPELDVRAFTLPDQLPPPTGDEFASTVAEVSPQVLARSSWHPGCPVAAEDLRYVTVSFWGFDGRAHTGELLVHHRAAAPVVAVFRQLFDARYPIEQLVIATAADLVAEPTGDGNNSGAFACRDVRGSTHWSQHAYGLAVDINPFQNPYRKGDLVIPELATSYLERDRDRPGMLHRDSTAVHAFADQGWGWGGGWRSAKDYMHFSENGR